ncbi:DMT family transporter [Thalassospira marina]|uniref:DMT family transporter n=1 Tax=Thalassospira marina TaxID=2048283 RepID=UPI0013FDE612|nr:DMT family transporter [Thalassospira marina]
MSNKNVWNYAGLHLAILSWGAAGVTSKLMTTDPAGIVVYRSIIAAIVLGLFCSLTRKGKGVSKRDQAYMIATGAMIGLHWWGFFAAIKVSTVSIALVCISSAPIFVALLQPIVEKTALKPSQILLGIISVAGIGIMFNFEYEHRLGIAIGLAAGAIDAVYSIMTSRTRETISNVYVTQMHMIGAFAVVMLISTAVDPSMNWLALETRTDYIGILFLGLVCSAIAMSLYVISIKQLSAFTATLSLNLEAVYGMIIALAVFGASEHMSPGFYIGAIMLVGSVVADAMLSSLNARKQVIEEMA